MKTAIGTLFPEDEFKGLEFLFDPNTRLNDKNKKLKHSIPLNRTIKGAGDIVPPLKLN